MHSLSQSNDGRHDFYHEAGFARQEVSTDGHASVSGSSTLLDSPSKSEIESPDEKISKKEFADPAPGAVSSFKPNAVELGPGGIPYSPIFNSPDSGGRTRAGAHRLGSPETTEVFAEGHLSEKIRLFALCPSLFKEPKSEPEDDATQLKHLPCTLCPLRPLRLAHASAALLQLQ